MVNLARKRFNYVPLIEYRLETGPAHQVWLSMQYIDHPLFNDDFFGGDRIIKETVFTKYCQFVNNCFTLCPRQALHAKEPGFLLQQCSSRH
jgi:23S rRNA pseudouridine1911/1915/1917 synthase